MTDTEIGKLIRDARKKVGMTQQELAKALGVTWEMVSRYERGRSSALLKILDIAQVLGVSVSAFFSESPIASFARQPNVEYLTETFVPVLQYVPAEKESLMNYVRGTSDGVKVSVVADSSAGPATGAPASGVGVGAAQPRQRNAFVNSVHFAIKLGEGSNVRVLITSVLPKGFALCRFVTEDPQSGDTVLVSRGGLVSIESYTPDMPGVLAKVVEWVVKL